MSDIISRSARKPTDPGGREAAASLTAQENKELVCARFDQFLLNCKDSTRFYKILGAKCSAEFSEFFRTKLQAVPVPSRKKRYPMSEPKRPPNRLDELRGYSSQPATVVRQLWKSNSDCGLSGSVDDSSVTNETVIPADSKTTAPVLSTFDEPTPCKISRPSTSSSQPVHLLTYRCDHEDLFGQAGQVLGEQDPLSEFIDLSDGDEQFDLSEPAELLDEQFMLSLLQGEPDDEN